MWHEILLGKKRRQRGGAKLDIILYGEDDRVKMPYVRDRVTIETGEASLRWT